MPTASSRSIVPTRRPRKSKVLTALVAFAGLLAIAVGVGAQSEPVTDYNVTDILHSEFDTQAAWGAGVHGSGRNDDFANISQQAPVNLKWQSQNGIGLIPGTVTPFNVAPNSDTSKVWVGSGRGVGYSSVYQFDSRTGETLFATPPYDGTENTVSSWAIVNQPNVDADGNAYIMDDKNLWSYTDAGELRWKTSLAGTGVTRPWIGNAVFTNEGLLGGATIDGWWLFLDPDTGEIEILQQFPPTIVQPCSPVLRALAVFMATFTGSFDPASAADLICGAIGQGVPITETTGYDSVNETILQNNSSEDGENGRVTAWKVATNDDGSLRLDQVWEALTVPGSATSPTVNLTDNLVYAADGNGTMNAFNGTTGELVWQSPPGLEVGFSPQTDEFGNLVAASMTAVNKFSAQDGTLIWSQNYDHLIPLTGLTPGPPSPLVPDPNPHSYITGLTVGGPDTLEVLIAFGYTASGGEAGEIAEEQGRRFIPIEHVTGTMLIDAETGEYIEGTLALQPTGRGPNGTGAATDVGAFPQTIGWNIIGQAELYSHFVYVPLNPLLADFYKVPPIAGGTWGAEVADHLQYAMQLVERSQEWNDEAIDMLTGPSPDPQRAFDLVRRAGPNLGVAAPSNIADAVANGQLTDQQAQQANRSIQRAVSLLTQAKDRLLNGGNQDPAVERIEGANEELSVALETLAEGSPAQPSAPFKSAAAVSVPDSSDAVSLAAGSSLATATDVGDTLRHLRQTYIRPLLPLRSERALLALARFAPFNGDQYDMEALQTLSVVRGSFYYRLGLRAGDVILTVNGEAMTSAAQTQVALEIFMSAPEIEVEIVRAGVPMTLTFPFP